MNRTSSNPALGSKLAVTIAYIAAAALFCAAPVRASSYSPLYVDTTSGIDEFNTSGTFVTSSTNQGLSTPYGIAFDGSGNVYVDQFGTATNNVTSFAPNLVSSSNYGSGTGATGTSGPPSGPVGNAFDKSGNLWIAEAGGQIGEIPAGPGTFTTVATGLSSVLYGMAIDSNGDLFASSNSGSVYEWVGSGGLPNVSGSPTFTYNNATYLSKPGGLAISPTNGDLYIADWGKNTIVQLAPGASPTYTNISTGLNYGAAATLADVAFDGAGNLYVGQATTNNTIDLVNQSNGLPDIVCHGTNQHRATVLWLRQRTHARAGVDRVDRERNDFRGPPQKTPRRSCAIAETDPRPGASLRIVPSLESPRLENGPNHTAAHSRAIGVPCTGRGGADLDRAGARMALWAVVSAIFTLLVLQYSFVRGRLLLPATYDDVIYLLDGLNRLETWYSSGLWAMLQGLRHQPSHAPFSTLLAIAGFALFGMRDWGPYAFDAVIIFTLLMFLDALLGKLRLRWKIAAALVALSTPIAGQSIAEFRPDMMAGLLSAMLVVMLLDGPIIGRGLWQSIGAGAIWGLTLWVKPSVFPVTLGLGWLALGLGTLRDIWLARPRRISRADIATAWIPVLVPAVLLPLPHYLVDGKNIVHYILTNEIGSQRGMWQLHASLKTHLLYYSTGQGGQAMLGVGNAAFFWIFLAVMIVGAAVLLIANRDRRLWATIGCGAIVGLAAYVVPTINPQKQAFLATPFDFLMLFGAILMVRQLTQERLSPLIGLLGAAMMAALVMVSLAFSQFPAAPGLDRASADVRTKAQTIANVYAVIHDHYQAGEKRVWLNLTGPLSTDTLHYAALKDGIALDFTGKADATDLDIYRRGYDKCDYVVAADPGVPDLPTNLASNLMLDKTLALIRSRPDFELLATVGVGDGLNYYIFHKIGQFHGWSQITGLASLEGPYPQWNMGHVRWGLGPATAITLDADSPRDVVLSMQVQSQFSEPQKLTILLDGRAIAEHAFKVPGKFDPVSVPMNLSAGPHHITIAYAIWTHDPVRPGAVVYARLEIDPGK